jgi:hypothetical protein
LTYIQTSIDAVNAVILPDVLRPRLAAEHSAAPRFAVRPGESLRRDRQTRDVYIAELIGPAPATIPRTMSGYVYVGTQRTPFVVRAGAGYAGLLTSDDGELTATLGAFSGPTTSTCGANPRHEPQFNLFADYDRYEKASWDGESAEPVTAEVRAIAERICGHMRDIADAPDVAPGVDGSIGMEWYRGESKVWVDVGPGTHIVTYYNFGPGFRGALEFDSFSPQLVSCLRSFLSMLYQRLTVL